MSSNEYFGNISKLVGMARSKTFSQILNNEKQLMSQGEMSHLLGYKNGQFVSNIERSKCSIPVKKICLLSQITGVTTDEIIKAILYDKHMTIYGFVNKTEPRKVVKIKLLDLIEKQNKGEEKC